MRDVPTWQAGGVAKWTPSSLVTARLTFLHVGPFIENSIPTGDARISGYARLDASANWKFSPNLTLYVAADNILNAHYQEAVGFPSPGTVVRLGAALAQKADSAPLMSDVLDW